MTVYITDGQTKHGLEGKGGYFQKRLKPILIMFKIIYKVNLRIIHRKSGRIATTKKREK